MFYILLKKSNVTSLLHFWLLCWGFCILIAGEEVLSLRLIPFDLVNNHQKGGELTSDGSKLSLMLFLM